MPPSRPSVIIVAHGSSISERAHEAAVQHAFILRQSNRYGAVDVCFLARQKDCPQLPEGEIFLLPFFMSNGYFVTNRIPDLFCLEAGERIEADRRLYQCDALGMDPELANIITVMGHEVCRSQSYDSKQVHLVLVAHGSETSKASSETAFLQRNALEERGEFGEVSVTFLNEPPYLEDWLAMRSEDGRPLIFVGMFAADGPHASEDVPAALDRWRAKFPSLIKAHYVGAVGTRPEIVRLIQHSISRCMAIGPRKVR